jgi:hypothetical protein
LNRSVDVLFPAYSPLTVISPHIVDRRQVLLISPFAAINDNALITGRFQAFGTRQKGVFFLGISGSFFSSYQRTTGVGITMWEISLNKRFPSVTTQS